MEWVIRGGVATPKQLSDGFGRHAGTATPLYGFSVQYQPGKTIDALVLMGQFHNGQISVAFDEDLQQAIQSVGYTMRLVKKSGPGLSPHLRRDL